MMEASDTIRSTQGIMIRVSLTCLALVSVAACATTPEPMPPAGVAAETPVAPSREAQLAELTARELARRARHDPDSLGTVYPELAALSLALAGVEAPEPGTAPEPEPGSDTGSLAPPPAAIDRARSQLHAIHLASYRGEETAARGWSALQARFPALAPLEARIEWVELDGQGAYFRLKAGPFDTAAAARDACAQVEAAGEYCRRVDFTGRRMADSDHREAP